MKKYNLSKIMKRAWELVKKIGLAISEALKKSWKEAKRMDVKEIIKKYNISLYGEDKIRVDNVTLLKKDKAEDTVKSKKPEIMAYLKEEKAAEKRAYEERKAKIKDIDGLEEIKNAIEEQIRWREDFNRAMESEDGCVGMRAKPEDNIAELKQKYPRAAAYIKAESESLKSNYELAAIGKKALEAIINGEDHEKVMEEMEEAHKAFAERHMWD